MHVKRIGIRLYKYDEFDINGYRMVLFSYTAMKHQLNFQLIFGCRRRQ
jgi:hypothetical protein